MNLPLQRTRGKPPKQIRLRPSKPEGLSIQYKLKTQGKSLSLSGRRIGVTRQSVAGVVSGHRRSARIEAEIARILGKASWNEVVLEARSEVQKKPVAVILREMEQRRKAREKEFFAGLAGVVGKARRGA